MTPTKTKPQIRARIKSVRHALTLLEAGLNGYPVGLHMTDGINVVRTLKAVGVELVSKTQLEKQGLVLRRGAKPLLSRYFGAPISKDVNLYDKNSQAIPKPASKKARAKGSK